ncbi:DUF2510 domain-containing protein [Streptomyces chiangmaiensis]|uniref:DUF2510 domain-containing protein n=1 Tax=Streptomyces chiangmaiensis TaxID=766497 RepID=A0ABU7FSB4_9ACTN|nr:DUF2510 domain-containing protein [Streptomyces chiangmaiensis]MED7826995.1 DUF2510 domain-containing protein [Streptomyces chiangmaiensis]
MATSGWYPDPWHEGGGPAGYRWWDGTAWTEHVQAPQPPQPPGGGKRRRGLVVGLIAGALVLVAGGVTAAVVQTGGDGGGKAPSAHGSASPDRHAPSPSASHRAQPSPSGSAGEDRHSGGSRPPGRRPAVTGHVDDTVNGLRVPVLRGWRGTSTKTGAGLGYGTVYHCPAVPADYCLPGGAYTRVIAHPGDLTLKELAQAEIGEVAQSTYGTNTSGVKDYGGITGHRRTAEGAVTVAGRKGYFIRWKVSTGKGARAVVEAVVFLSPRVQGRYLLLGFGFDDNSKGPSVTDMQWITDGIERLDGGGSGISA